MPPIDRTPAASAMLRDAAEQRRLVAALAVELARRHGVPDALVVETHISYVLIAGDAAYKLKKSLKLPFVDYSTLALRKHYCEEELRLNGRLAPQLYREVVAIRGTPQAPVLDGDGEPLEYAVAMRAFAQDDLLAVMLEQRSLGREHVDEFAREVAAFHARIASAAAGSPYGAPERVLADAMENFEEIVPLADQALQPMLAALRDWTQDEFLRCSATIADRRSAGFVREGHGDLHLGNAARVDGRVVLFDGIEFNPGLRWIDVMSEAAFAAMDLADRGREDLGWRFLDGYLEASGDYAGVAVLRFHLVYRALVRAKVRFLRAAQLADAADAQAARAEAVRYVALAARLAQAVAPVLIVTHGPAGSGKTTFTQALVEQWPALRIRSDVERKRLAGLAATAATGSPIDAGAYGDAATRRTYGRLAQAAKAVLDAGYAVILDATFLARRDRRRMRELAEQCGAPFVLLDFQVPEPVLRARVAQRAARAGDASEATVAVLERQLARREPLDETEQALAVPIREDAAPEAVVAALRARLPSLSP
jgi:hypothetical protein